MVGENFRYVSFFSGALGLDLGLEEAGWSAAAVNELDPVICRTIRRNRPHLKLFDCDIRELSTETFKRDLHIAEGELFAIVGGPPCQAFSTAGRRLGLNDERGNVFLHFLHLIVGLKPRYAIFENVRGLLSAPLLHRPHDSRGLGFAPLQEEELAGGALLHILRMLESAGYATTFTLYNTANFGVPQIRERLIFFASRDGSAVPFMRPSHSEHGIGGSTRWRDLRDALSGLNEPEPQHLRFPEHRVHYLRLLEEGQNWRDLPPHLQQKAMGQSWHAKGGKTGFYRRLAWNKPAPTLVTRPNMPATMLCHPDEVRPLSVLEYARIQTFPDGYQFEGGLEDQYRQIGNAVPVAFGRCIGTHLVDFHEGKIVGTTNGRVSRYVGTDHVSWRSSLGVAQERLTF